MAATHAKANRRIFPIVYRRPAAGRSGGTTALAWIFFFVVGLPFLLMTVLVVLARGGVYLSLFAPLWQPWPPDLYKPFVGLAIFGATLAYLAFSAGHRRGFSLGVGVGLSAMRASEESKAASNLRPKPEESPPPPPPPPEEPAPEQTPD